MLRELVTATNNGQQETVRSLIADGVDLGTMYSNPTPLMIQIGFNNDKTPLMLASYNNQEAIAHFLIEQGADVNEVNESQKTALMFAILSGNPNLVKCLLNAGANLESKDNRGASALMYTFMSSNPGDLAGLLLSYGSDISIRDVNGETIFMYAVKSGSLNAVSSAIYSYANAAHEDINDRDQAVVTKNYINLSNHNGDTPLILAAFCGYKNIAELLLHNGADVNIRNNNGENALMLSIRGAYYPFSQHSDYKGVTKLLLDHDADIYAINKQGVSSITLDSTAEIKSLINDYMSASSSSKKFRPS